MVNSFATLADKKRENEMREITRGQRWAIMESLSIWHWVIVVMVFPMMVSPMLGIVRSVKNGAVFHVFMSSFIPAYGLIYFFAAKSPRK
jgi:ABC-type microcin C transport system permease subunit YejB